VQCYLLAPWHSPLSARTWLRAASADISARRTLPAQGGRTRSGQGSTLLFNTESNKLKKHWYSPNDIGVLADESHHRQSKKDHIRYLAGCLPYEEVS
jgi:hypothetical protein